MCTTHVLVWRDQAVISVHFLPQTCLCSSFICIRGLSQTLLYSVQLALLLSLFRAPNHHPILCKSMAPFVGDGEQSQITLASDEIEGHVRFPPTPDSGSKYSTPATNGNKSEDTTIKDHLAWVIEHDSRLHACIGPEGEAEGHHEAIVVNGQDLSLAELVAVARYVDSNCRNL